MLLMFSAAPVVWEGDPGLKLRDLIVEFSRWILGPSDTSSLTHLASSVSLLLWQLTRPWLVSLLPLADKPRWHQLV